MTEDIKIYIESKEDSINIVKKIDIIKNNFNIYIQELKNNPSINQEDISRLESKINELLEKTDYRSKVEDLNGVADFLYSLPDTHDRVTDFVNNIRNSYRDLADKATHACESLSDELVDLIDLSINDCESPQELNRAIKELNELSEKVPSNTKILALKAKYYTKLKRYLDALECLDELAVLDPENNTYQIKRKEIINYMNKK